MMMRHEPYHSRLACITLLNAASAWSASVFVEQQPGAGRFPATAQTVEGAGPVDVILGNLTSLTSVDTYRFKIVDPLNFSAMTTDTPFNVSDPQLFLFNKFGWGVYMNDDFSGSQSQLEAGHPRGPLVAGIYFLAIGWFDNEPFSGLGRIFGDGSGTNGRDPVGGAGPVSSWNDDVSGRIDLPTSYEIRLTGVEAVPEPGAFWLMASAVIGLLAAKRRNNLVARCGRATRTSPDARHRII